MTKNDDATQPAPARTASDGADHTVAASNVTLASTVPVVIRAGAVRDYEELKPIDPTHFVVGNEIARGGMGRIRTARDRRLGRTVAIKELLSNSRELRVRFEREARITARLQHPAIVNILEAGEWPSGEPFYVMKLVTGQSFDKVIASKTTLEQRLSLLPNVIAVVDALAYAHSENIIHRDLKPANVLVGDFGETVVIDWGLAKDLSTRTAEIEEPAGPYRMAAAADGETVAGSVMGTPAYMPVEQAAGKAVDARADVYSLGAILYHVLAGSPPFSGKTVEETLDRVINDKPASITSRVPRVPPDLVTIVEKAMAHDADARYPTAKELADDLKKFQTGQLVGAHRYSTWQLVARWTRRHRIAIAVASAALVLLVTLGSISLRRIFAEQRATERQSTLARKTRGEAEGLMTFMLSDLRDKLQPLGKVKLLEDVATRAIAYYANRTDTLSDEEQTKRAEARRNLGDVLKAQGDAARAMTEYRASMATVEALSAKHPANDELRHDLAVNLYKIGNVLLAQGDSAGALAAYKRQRDISEALATKVPTNSVWVRYLALSQMNVGRASSALGDTAGALAAFRESLVIRKRLAASDPANTEWQRDLAAIHTAIGEKLQLQGDAAGALVAFRESLAVASPLAAKDAMNASWQLDLAVGHQKIGEVLVAQGDATGALAEFRAALAIYTALAAKDPDDAYAQSDVSGVQVQIGEILLAKGDAAGATAAFRSTLAISKALAAKDATNADRQWGVAFSHEKVGDGLRGLGDGKGALAEYQASLAVAQVMANNDPTHADKQRAVSAAREKIGDQLLELGDQQRALAEYQASFTISEAAAAADPTNADKQRGLAIAHIKLGDVLIANGNPKDALARFRLSLAILDKLATDDPTSASRQSDLAISQSKVGKALLKLADNAGALAAFRSFQAASVKLAATDPSNLGWQGMVVEAHDKVGDALYAQRDRSGALAEYKAGLALARTLAAIDPTFAEYITALAAKTAR